MIKWWKIEEWFYKTIGWRSRAIRKWCRIPMVSEYVEPHNTREYISHCHICLAVQLIGKDLGRVCTSYKKGMVPGRENCCDDCMYFAEVDFLEQGLILYGHEAAICYWH